MVYNQKQTYQEISIMVPLNNPATLEKQQCNKKLYHLLRWLRYNLPGETETPSIDSNRRKHQTACRMAATGCTRNFR